MVINLTNQMDQSMMMWEKVDLVKKLSYRTGSPYEMTSCAICYFTGNWKIGTKLSGGSYDGMIGMVVRGEGSGTALP